MINLLSKFKNLSAAQMTVLGFLGILLLAICFKFIFLLAMRPFDEGQIVEKALEIGSVTQFLSDVNRGDIYVGKTSVSLINNDVIITLRVKGRSEALEIQAERVGKEVSIVKVRAISRFSNGGYDVLFQSDEL